MSTSDRTNDKLFASARASLQRASREEKLSLLRRSGVLADHPHPGDKVASHDKFGDIHFGVVVGVDQNQRKWMVVRNGRDGVELATLYDFAFGGTVELVDRAPEGHGEAAAKAALELIGRPTDLKHFLYTESPTATEGAKKLLTAVAMGALAFAAIALLSDQTWGTETGRYRDRRGAFG